jgi:hypothetical protein
MASHGPARRAAQEDQGEIGSDDSGLDRLTFFETWRRRLRISDTS